MSLNPKTDPHWALRQSLLRKLNDCRRMASLFTESRAVRNVAAMRFSYAADHVIYLADVDELHEMLRKLNEFRRNNPLDMPRLSDLTDRKSFAA